MTEEKEQQKANEIFDKATKALQHIEEEVVIFPPTAKSILERQTAKKSETKQND